jgi:adenylate cyclase, class 2
MAKHKVEKYLTRQFEQRVASKSVEREQKYRIADPGAIRKRLLLLRAVAHHSGFERNEIFDCHDQLRDQRLKLRLRRHGSDVAMMTLKGPRMTGANKARMEVETPVQYEPAKRILELLGFRVNETYSKLREEYRLDGCPVCLDHIPECGWFAEIEGTARKISKIARQLGLRPEDRERRSYRKLIKDHTRPGGARLAA